jgi:hypothetical protein
MDDDRLDLSPLEPDPEHLDRAAKKVLARAQGALDGRRRVHGSMWGALPGWERPLLAAAAAAALLSIVVLLRVHPDQSRQQVATLSEVAGVPAPIAHWVDSGEPPDAASLLDW